jgi:signal transduction histidine kinase
MGVVRAAVNSGSLAQIVMQPIDLRKTGISSVGEVPWGTHFCHFYQTKQDLFDILIPYFISGLKNHEFCMWVVYDPLDETDARRELISAFPAAAQHLSKGDIQIEPPSGLYLKHGSFDLRRTVEAWHEMLANALARGYAGIRANGSVAWVREADWESFTQYERLLDELIINKRMIVLCTYPLASATAGELFDVARTHQFAIAKRRGNWEILETPELKQTKEALRQLSQHLELRVAQRTAELATTNQALISEIAEHRETMEQLRALSERLRALSASIQSAREEEGTRIAREIHDELGSALTALKWDIEGLLPLVSTEDPAVQEKLNAVMRLADSMIHGARRIASELRPSILDDLGLIEAIEWQAQAFQDRTGIVSSFDSTLDTAPLDHEQSIAVFRIVQEALTNILRHANATRVDIAADEQAGEFILTIRDNGKGITDEAKSRPLSLGLLGMQERAHLVSGTIDIKGTEGKGTTVTLHIPVSRPAEP